MNPVVEAPSALDDDDRREVLWHTYLAVQREQHAQGALPDVDRTVLSRVGGLLAVIGALQLGALVAALGVFAIFIVTRLILHLDFTRYFGG